MYNKIPNTLMKNIIKIINYECLISNFPKGIKYLSSIYKIPTEVQGFSEIIFIISLM